MTCDVGSVDDGLSFVSKNSATTPPITFKPLSVNIFFGLRTSCDTKGFIGDNNEESFKTFNGYAKVYLFALAVIMRAYLIPLIVVPTPYSMS